MTKKKPVNWAAIKKRYLTGEKPKDIAEDFGLTSKQIRDKASTEGWTRQKTAIIDKIADVVLSDLEEIHTIYGALIKDTGLALLKARRDGLQGLTVQDGEGLPNHFALNDQKAGLASYLEKQKHAHKLELAALEQQDPNEDEPPGFNVSPDA